MKNSRGDTLCSSNLVTPTSEDHKSKSLHVRPQETSSGHRALLLKIFRRNYSCFLVSLQKTTILATSLDKRIEEMSKGERLLYSFDAMIFNESYKKTLLLTFTFSCSLFAATVNCYSSLKTVKCHSYISFE